MINLTKKTPYRRNDLVCTYGNEGQWIGFEIEMTAYDPQTECFFYSLMYHYNCYSGDKDPCDSGDVLSDYIPPIADCD